MAKFICDFCGKEYTRAGSGKNRKQAERDYFLSHPQNF